MTTNISKWSSSLLFTGSFWSTVASCSGPNHNGPPIFKGAPAGLPEWQEQWKDDGPTVYPPPPRAPRGGSGRSENPISLN